jgi:predicted house-cleaning noncanonical NTP pyrophosphatase (MazG superfamily)
MINCLNKSVLHLKLECTTLYFAARKGIFIMRKEVRKVDKLIRDKLPQIMRASGIKVFVRVMEKDEYLKRLKDKILEEAKEVIASRSEKEMREELADLLEVMLALAKIHGMEFTDIQQTAQTKRLEKGGFDDKILLLGTKT